MMTFSKLYFYFRLKGQTEKPFAVVFIYGSQRPGWWSILKKKDGSGGNPVSPPTWWQTEGLALCESPAFYEWALMFAGTTREPSSLPCRELCVFPLSSLPLHGPFFPSFWSPFHNLSLCFLLLLARLSSDFPAWPWAPRRLCCPYWLRIMNTR